MKLYLSSAWGCANPRQGATLEQGHQLDACVASSWRNRVILSGRVSHLAGAQLLSVSSCGLRNSGTSRTVAAATTGGAPSGDSAPNPTPYQRARAPRTATESSLSPSPQTSPSQPPQQPPPSQPPRPRFRLVAREGAQVEDRQLPEDNPSLDDIVLDEQYYREMGISPQEVQETLRQYDASELDPEGFNLGPGGGPTSSPAAAALWASGQEGPGGPAGGDGGNLLMGSGIQLLDDRDDDEEVYGPEAILLAGFFAEEHAMVRAVLDSAGGHVIKVLPVTEAMLHGTVEEAVHAPELDWAEPRAQNAPRGAGFGAQRTVMFSGLSFRAQLTLLELLESGGLQAVCATAAREDQAGRRLGEVLAEAVASQRSQASRMPRQELWQQAAAAAAAATASEGGGTRFTDPRVGLPSLDDLLGQQAVQRAKQLRSEARGGAAAAPEGAAASEASAGPGTSTAGPAAAARPVAGPAAPPGPQATPAGGIGGFSVEDPEVLRPDGPALGEEGLRAAEAVAADWAAWRSRAEAGDDSDPADLAKYGVDLGRLREDVLARLSEMDPEEVEQYLLDSPFEDGQGQPMFQWQEEEEGGPGSGVEAAAGSGAEGPTLEGLRQVAERQRRRWQEAQERMETAAAAEGRLVLEAESELLRGSPSEGKTASRAAADAAAAAAASSRPPPSSSSSSPSNRGTDPSPSSPTGGAPRTHASSPAPHPLTPSEAASPPQPDFDLGLGGMDGFSELDDLLGQLEPAGGSGSTRAASPGAPAPASAPSATSPTADAAPVPGAAADAAGGSVLEQLRAAASGGAAPEALQKMLDEMYGLEPPEPEPSEATAEPPEATAMAAPATPPPAASVAETSGRGVRVSDTFPMPEPTAATAAVAASGSSKKRRGSLFAHLKKPPPPPPKQQQQPDGEADSEQRPGRPKRSYGPAPPPEPDPVLKPLLDLRPDVAKAFQDKKVKFMDLSKLNDKQKRQFLEYQARKKFEQQLARHEQKQRGEEGDGAARGERSGEEATEEEEEGEEDEYEEDEEEDEEGSDDKEGGVTMTSSKLRELVEASQAEGISLEDTLAQAVAMGVRMPDRVLREVGVQPPSEAALERARADYARMFAEWATEEGLSASPDAAAAPDGGDHDGDHDDPQASSPDPLGAGAVAGGQGEEALPGGLGAANAAAEDTDGSSGSSSSSQLVEDAAPVPPGLAPKARPWGAGLARPRRVAAPPRAGPA